MFSFPATFESSPGQRLSLAILVCIAIPSTERAPSDGEVNDYCGLSSLSRPAGRGVNK